MKLKYKSLLAVTLGVGMMLQAPVVAFAGGTENETTTIGPGLPGTLDAGSTDSALVSGRIDSGRDSQSTSTGSAPASESMASEDNSQSTINSDVTVTISQGSTNGELTVESNQNDAVRQEGNDYHITESIDSSKNTNADALTIQSKENIPEGEKATIKIENKEITSAKDKDAVKITTPNANVDTYNSTIKGNVEVTDGDLSMTKGSVTGDVKVEGGKVSTNNTTVDGSVNVIGGQATLAGGEVTGNVVVKNETDTNTDFSNPDVRISDTKVNGAINVENGTVDVSGDANNINVSNNGRVSVRNGDVNSVENSGQVYVVNGNVGTVNNSGVISIVGNVKEITNEGVATVDGTITGEVKNNGSLTVYEIEQFKKNDATAEEQEGIFYIIRHDSNVSDIQVIFSRDEADKLVGGSDTNNTTKASGKIIINAAHAGQEFTIKLTDGYQLSTKITARKLADGTYLLSMPNGGGLTLETIKKISDAIKTNEITSSAPSTQVQTSSEDSTPSTPSTKAPTITVVTTNPGSALPTANLGNANAVTKTISLDLTKMTDSQYKEAVITNIAAVPESGVFVIETNGLSFLDKEMVAAIMKRPDLAVNLVFVYNGKRISVVIPAGYDLSTLLNSEGYCGYLKLLTAFEPTYLD